MIASSLLLSVMLLLSSYLLPLTLKVISSQELQTRSNKWQCSRALFLSFRYNWSFQENLRAASLACMRENIHVCMSYLQARNFCYSFKNLTDFQDSLWAASLVCMLKHTCAHLQVSTAVALNNTQTSLTFKITYRLLHLH